MAAPDTTGRTGRWPARWQGYRRGALGDDLVAAAIVTVLLVPQSLAYAMLAGLPPVVGVVASLLPILAYAVLGSSTTLAVGPVAVLAMMTAQAAAPVAAAHGVEPLLAAMVLAIESGGILLLAMLLRMEVFAALLSAPVLHGFMTGAAVWIAVAQLPVLTGLPVKGATGLELAESLASAPSLQPHAATTAFGLLALASLWLLRRHGAAALARLGLRPRAAQLAARVAPVAVVASCVAVVATWPLAGAGVALAGSIDLRAAWPVPPLWSVPADLWWDLAAPATLIALVGYVESLAVAEALAARRGEKILPRRELLGLGVANLASGATGGMPVTGGFARSVVNFDAGARTRMAGVWTVAFLATAMLLLGDLLGYLPRAVLAATIVVAVTSLIDTAPMQRAWRYARAEFALMVGVAALTLLLGVEAGLLAGVLASIGLMLQRTARPHWAEVGRIPGTEVFRNVLRYRVETWPHVLTVRIDESLLFTNSRWLAETLAGMAAGRPGLRHVVLMMSGVNDIDFTGMESLEQLGQELGARGVQLHLSELKGPVRDRLEAIALPKRLSGRVFQTQSDAWHALVPAAQATPSIQDTGPGPQAPGP